MIWIDLETIDDDAEEEGIQMVKTTDLSAAEELNIHDFPAFVYYQGGIPTVYKGKQSIYTLLLYCIVFECN